METEKLYDRDPYECHATVKVTEVNGRTAVFDSTVFFPEEGGQTCDRGSVSSGEKRYEVTDVQIKDGVIYHTLSEEPDFAAGDEVEESIDWEHRFDNMQNHTGEHIFSGLVHGMKGYDNVGFSLTENTCQMDYNGKLTDGEIARIEEEANEVIWKSLAVDCRYPSPDELKQMEYRSKKELRGPVRIVTIPGVDCCACCAPHVRTTSEVGVLKVLSHMNYKGGTRLYIACGKRAYREFTASFDSLGRIGHLFSTGRSDAEAAVRKLIDEKNALKEKLSGFEREELFRQVENAGNAPVFTRVTDKNILTAAFNHWREVSDGILFIFSEKTAGEYTFLAGGGGTDARSLLAALKEHLGARGGGSAMMIQGSIEATKEKILLELKKVVG